MNKALNVILIIIGLYLLLSFGEFVLRVLLLYFGLSH